MTGQGDSFCCSPLRGLFLLPCCGDRAWSLRPSAAESEFMLKIFKNNIQNCYFFGASYLCAGCGDRAWYLRHSAVKWKVFSFPPGVTRDSKAAQREPKSGQRRPKGNQRRSKGSSRRPKRRQREPKDSPRHLPRGPREPKVVPKAPKIEPREPKVVPKEATGTPKTPVRSQRDKIYIQKLPINRTAAVMLANNTVNEMISCHDTTWYHAMT